MHRLWPSLGFAGLVSEPRRLKKHLRSSHPRSQKRIGFWPARNVPQTEMLGIASPSWTHRAIVPLAMAGKRKANEAKRWLWSLGIQPLTPGEGRDAQAGARPAQAGWHFVRLVCRVMTSSLLFRLPLGNAKVVGPRWSGVSKWQLLAASASCQLVLEHSRREALSCWCWLRTRLSITSCTPQRVHGPRHQ